MQVAAKTFLNRSIGFTVAELVYFSVQNPFVERDTSRFQNILLFLAIKVKLGQTFLTSFFDNDSPIVAFAIFQRQAHRPASHLAHFRCGSSR